MVVHFPWLFPLGLIYGWITKVRAEFYRRGLFRCGKLPCFVVSVGNGVLGGTGKTPATIWLAEYFQKSGIKVTILSRGYKARSNRPAGIVSNGKNIVLGPVDAGDEPYMMAGRLPGVPLIIGKKRFDAGMKAVKEFQPGVILLDDGYQHLALYRDLNVLLLRASKIFGNGLVFPAGDLREPVSAFNRADAFVLTYCKEVSPDFLESQKQALGKLFPDKPVFVSWSEPVSVKVRHRNNWYSTELKKVEGKRIFAFCGIATPESFYSSLKEVQIEVADFCSFKDHYQYKGRDLEDIEKRAKRAGAELIITTEKDFVKVDGLPQGDISLGFLETRFVFENGFEKFISDFLKL